MSTPSEKLHTGKRRLSRRSGSPSQLSSDVAAKKVKEEPVSNHSSPTLLGNREEAWVMLGSASDDEDVYVPPADDDPDASEVEFQAELDEDAGHESDAVGALSSRTKQARALGKWDADAKRARYNDKYGEMEPEEALVHLAQKWRSDAYAHFKFPTVVVDNDGVVYHRFVCKSHPGTFLDRVAHEDSTSNLLRHIRACDPEPTPEAQTITAFVSGTTYSQARLRFLLALWVARRHHPFAVVEDPELREIFRMLYGRVEIPSRISVAHDIHVILEEAKGHLGTKLASLPGKIHLCVDGWTSPNFISFLGVTAHWVVGAQLQNVTLDFIRLNKAHTGKYLGGKLVKSLQNFGIEDKIMAVTCDNAANNATMLREMHVLVPEFRGTTMRVRCFGHILNLIVKAILSQFTRRADKKPARKTRTDFDTVLADLERENTNWEGLDDDDDDDEAEADIPNVEDDGNETDEARDAADEAEIEAIEEDHPVLVLDAEQALSGKLALEKVLKLASKIFINPHARSELASLAKCAKLKSQVIVRPVRTRWNTVTCTLARAIEMKEPLCDLCDMVQFNQPGGLRLRRFYLTPEDWTILEDLHRLLDPFLFATNTMSSTKHALIQDVIPYIDILTEHLDQVADDATRRPVVRAAAKRGLIILNRYYSRTDDGPIYRVAMMLHPAFKEDYFTKHDWSADWKDKARRILREEWQTRYKPAPPINEPQGAILPPPARASRPGHLSAAASTAAATRALFGTVNAHARSSTKDALEEYLLMPIVESLKDPIAYWDGVLQTAGDNRETAALARMALDYLTIPATSTDAERAFSRGGLTVSRLRHSLGDASVRASALLASWSRIPDLVPEKDTIQLLKTMICKNRANDGGDDGDHPGTTASRPAKPRPRPAASTREQKADSTRTGSSSTTDRRHKRDQRVPLNSPAISCASSSSSLARTPSVSSIASTGVASSSQTRTPRPTRTSTTGAGKGKSEVMSITSDSE